jgi:glycosyltransferase involved in cell wall biosynthesis
MRNKPTLSIVLPCFNEEQVIENSYQELKPLLNKWLNSGLIAEYQLVMVNNGSLDKTLEKMIHLKKSDSKIKIIDLRSNYGYQGSITAGLYNADYEMIVSIDADLQDDPVKIEDMIHSYIKGYDMVLGIRDDRNTDSFLKKITAEGFYKFMTLLGAKSVYNHGDFRLLSKTLIDNLKQYPERNRYLRGIILSLDHKYEKVFYKRRIRTAGETKFKPLNLISLALDGITSFSVAPIRFVFFLGLLMFFISIVVFFGVLYLKFFKDVEIQGWTSLMIMILFFGGIQNISLGILGEYLAKTYIESKGRPLFIIREIL